MANIMLVMEYDGTAYHGFQRQGGKIGKQTGLPTIQGDLEEAIVKLAHEEVRVLAASRTDAGTHAEGQVVNFQTSANYAASTWVEALNFYLPDDIVVREAKEVEEAFHARRSALSREYRYRVLNRPVPSPFWRLYAYYFPSPLEVGVMQEAANSMVGSHDFSAFSGVKGTRGRVARRRLLQAAIEREGDLVNFKFVGNAFLPQQVRTMVGTLLLVGTGQMDGEGFRRVLESRDRALAGPTAPACGLCLVRVNYPPD